ncbi:radical SAM protein [Aureibaculum algae]|uniref:Radical SAM protein n=1 Tax=Aureibaculum algae TaxID=2584122 RepID=A0A5B7TTY1_9FLAO|nr:radical SAM protein [Aureibaculum algae]QCX38683.1 radical SAM protein [Aureibaculum algae]
MMTLNTKNSPCERKTRNDNFLDGFRVIHLHPNLSCNLSCKHCYSSSAPGLKKELDSNEIIGFLKYAWEYGFNALSVSGGEPFLYSSLSEVLKESKNIGYKNLVASNGMLLKSERAKNILKDIDLIAVSIDGDELLHDEIRNFKGAYSKMIEGVEILKELDIDFGFIHTLTPKSWDLILWLSKFAKNNGAKLLQLHPLELYGRAKVEMNTTKVDQQLLHKVYILGNFLKSKYYPELLFQLDFLHRDNMVEHPESATYFGTNFNPDKTNLSQALKTVVIDENGTILPISYGFSDKFNIGNINEIAQNIDVFDRFINEKWESLYQLLEDTYFSIVNDKENDLVAWTELIVKNSNSHINIPI